MGGEENTDSGKGEDQLMDMELDLSRREVIGLIAAILGIPASIITITHWVGGGNNNSSSNTTVTELPPTDTTTSISPTSKTSNNTPKKGEPPNADFTYTPKEPSWRETVVFDGGISHDPDSRIISYEWLFQAPMRLPGEGEQRKGKQVTYKFETSGSHSVTLFVRSNDGQKDNEEKLIEVSGPVQP